MNQSLKTKDISPRKGEMIKPKEIIGIGGIEGWSLADRRTWNLLLINAWNDRLEDPTADFTIQLSELRGLHDSNDRIKQSLERLQKTLVTATLPDGTVRTVQMLGGTDIKDSDRTEGVLKYDFHRKLVPLLRESEIYARMEVKVLSAFTSKYALALYEIISTKINLRKSSEEIDLDTLRQWLGVDAGKLGTWSNLWKFAIKRAVKELNSLSPYTVEIDPIRQGRKVVKVCISWEKKQPFSPAEQSAVREVNRLKHGRKARLNDTVERIALTLTEDQIQKGYDASEHITRIDKQAAYIDWQEYVSKLKTQPTNPVGHFIDFCKKRARDLK